MGLEAPKLFGRKLPNLAFAIFDADKQGSLQARSIDGPSLYVGYCQ